MGEFIPSMDDGGATVKPNLMYRWKADTDEIVEHSAPIKLYSELSKMTGMSLNDINKNLREKSNIIRWMVKEGISNVHDVGAVMREYYNDPQAVIDRAGANENV